MSHWADKHIDTYDAKALDVIESKADELGWYFYVSENDEGPITLFKPEPGSNLTEDSRLSGTVSENEENTFKLKDTDVTVVSMVNAAHLGSISIEYYPSAAATPAVKDTQTSFANHEIGPATEWLVNILEQHEDKN